MQHKQHLISFFTQILYFYYILQGLESSSARLNTLMTWIRGVLLTYDMLQKIHTFGDNPNVSYRWSKNTTWSVSFPSPRLALPHWHPSSVWMWGVKTPRPHRRLPGWAGFPPSPHPLCSSPSASSGRSDLLSSSESWRAWCPSHSGTNDKWNLESRSKGKIVTQQQSEL